jgi:hypothetical protein
VPLKPPKIVLAFRIDPRLKEAAIKAARELKLTLSKYVQEMIRLDLWRKGLLGLVGSKQPAMDPLDQQPRPSHSAPRS